jgi:CO dehydrogenase maturation factor
MCEGHDHEHVHVHDHQHDHNHDHDHDAGSLDQFRVVITGKGGVGKTSLTAVLSRLLSRRSFHVLALDSDPQMNLPYALGVGRDAARALVPLSHNAAYVEEKTGSRPGAGWGLFFRLNPDVHDVVDRFGVVAPDHVHLLVMGTIVQPAAGCLCPENSLLAAVAGAVSLRRGEAIFLDTQAGVEHFGRALAKGFRHAVVVTDPTFNGVQVALHAARLARKLGIPAVHLVVNRVRRPEDLDKVRRIIDEEGGFAFTSEHALPDDERLLATEPDVGPLLDAPGDPFVASAAALADALVHTEEELASCAS